MQPAEDLPLEQSYLVFDEVIRTDGHVVHPEAALLFMKLSGTLGSTKTNKPSSVAVSVLGPRKDTVVGRSFYKDTKNYLPAYL